MDAGDRYQQSGAPHERCSRLLLQPLVDKLAKQGITTQTTFEIEWVISRGSSDEFSADEFSADEFASDEVLAAAFGQPVVDSIVAVRESELELFEGASPEDVGAATRWVH